MTFTQPGPKCEELRLSKSGPHHRDERTSDIRGATSQMGQQKTSHSVALRQGWMLSPRHKTTMAISVANHHDRDTAELPDEGSAQSQTSQRGCSGNILSARCRTSVTYAPSASTSDQANVSDGMILVVGGERWIGRHEMQRLAD